MQAGRGVLSIAGAIACKQSYLICKIMLALFIVLVFNACVMREDNNCCGAANENRNAGKADALPSMRASSEMLNGLEPQVSLPFTGSNETPAGIDGVNRGITSLTCGRAAHESTGSKPSRSSCLYMMEEANNQAKENEMNMRGLMGLWFAICAAFSIATVVFVVWVIIKVMAHFSII